MMYAGMISKNKLTNPLQGLAIWQTDTTLQINHTTLKRVIHTLGIVEYSQMNYQK